MPDWIPIRIRTERGKMMHMKNRIMGYPEEAMTKYYFQQLQSITASAADVMKNFIEYDRSVRTPTGEARKARGGNGPGRKDTGTMINGITWRGEKISDAKYKFEFGWLNGEPGYAIFQEHGTKNGVRAMHALEYAAQFARTELGFLGNSNKAVRVSRAARWRQEVGGNA